MCLKNVKAHALGHQRAATSRTNSCLGLSENLNKKSKFSLVKYNLKMYFVKSYYEITLMHLLTI